MANTCNNQIILIESILTCRFDVIVISLYCQLSL